MPHAHAPRSPQVSVSSPLAHALKISPEIRIRSLLTAPQLVDVGIPACGQVPRHSACARQLQGRGGREGGKTGREGKTKRGREEDRERQEQDREKKGLEKDDEEKDKDKDEDEEEDKDKDKEEEEDKDKEDKDSKEEI